MERRTSLKPIDNRTPHLDVKSSISTPLKHTVDAQERIQFLREMEKTREELAEFKRNVNALIEQMDGISIDLVCNISFVFFTMKLTHTYSTLGIIQR